MLPTARTSLLQSSQKVEIKNNNSSKPESSTTIKKDGKTSAPGFNGDSSEVLGYQARDQRRNFDSKLGNQSKLENQLEIAKLKKAGLGNETQRLIPGRSGNPYGTFSTQPVIVR